MGQSLRLPAQRRTECRSGQKGSGPMDALELQRGPGRPHALTPATQTVEITGKHLRTGIFITSASLPKAHPRFDAWLRRRRRRNVSGFPNHDSSPRSEARLREPTRSLARSVRPVVPTSSLRRGFAIPHKPMAATRRQRVGRPVGPARELGWHRSLRVT